MFDPRRLLRFVVAACLSVVASLRANVPDTGGPLWVPGQRVLDILIRTRPVAITSDVKTVTTGLNCTFFIRADDSLWAMGENFAGQLGTGDTADRATPVQISTDVASVLTAQSQTFFLKKDATLWAIGSNAFGSFGYDTGNGSPRTTPFQIGSSVKAVASPSGCTLFLKLDGTVWAAGNNDFGQLGLNPSTSPTLSAFTQIATNVASIAVQNNASFLLKTDGTLWVTGKNTYGRLGTGNTSNVSSLVQVAADVASVIPGDLNTFFFKTDATLWAMGRNDLGQLGDGTTTDRLTPVQVASNVSQVRSSGGATFFIKNDHTLWSIGSNYAGQLGDGTTADRSTPFQMATDVAAVEALWGNTYFRKLDGSLWSVGDNFGGQLGDGTRILRTIPQQIAARTSAIATSGQFVMYLTTDSELFGVGVRGSGQLGDGISIPERVLLTSEVPSVQMGASTIWYVKADGTLWSAFLGQIPGVADAVEVSVDDYDGSPIYRKSDGTVLQLGVDFTSTVIATDVARIFSGNNYRLFLKNDQTLWGKNVSPPQALQPAFGNGVDPALVASNVASVSAAADHFLFTKVDHSLWGQGALSHGWPDGAQFVANPVQLETEVSVASAYWASAYVKTDGHLWIRAGWSSGGAPAEEVTTGVTDVGTGFSSAYYLKTDGSLYSRVYPLEAPGTETLVAPHVAQFSAATFENFLAFTQNPGGSAPVITSAPQPVTASHGDAFSLEVTATGPAPLDYQWYRNGAPLSHERGATLHIPYATATDTGDYTVKVTNRGGSVTSTAAAVTIPKLAATVTLGSLSALFDGSPKAASATTNPAGLTVTFTYDGAATPPTAAGSYAVVATIDDDIYAGQVGDTLVVDKATQPAPAISSGASTPFGQLYQATVSTSSVGALEWALASGSTAQGATIDPATGVVGFTSIGTVKIKARYAGDSSHYASDYSPDFTLTVSPQPVTFSLSASSFSFNLQMQGPTVVADPAHATFTTGGTVQAANVGNYTATATATGNYTGSNNSLAWSIEKAIPNAPGISSPTTTIQGLPYTATANAGYRMIEWSLGSGSTAPGAAIDSSTGIVTTTGPGSVVIKARFLEEANYLTSPYSADFPVTVSPALGVISMSAGGRHTVFILSDGSLWGMGTNGYGQLGDGTTTERRHPIRIATGVVAASAGTNHTLFLKADGSLWGVGNNSDGNLGDGTLSERHQPVQVATDVAAVSAGNTHSLFLKRDGTLWGMGRNLGGMLGQGSATAPQKIPLQIATEVLTMSAGEMSSAFVKTDHSLWMMGNNGYGQLGDGTTIDKLVPTLISTEVISVSVGELHSAFLKIDRSLWAMGNFYAIQTGANANVVTPVQVDTGVSLASANDMITLYLKPDRALWATGTNAYGAFGDGSAPSYAGAQSPHPVGSDMIDVSMGGNAFSLRLKSDGTLLGAGLSIHGELGTEVNTDYNSAIVITGGPIVAPAAPASVTVTEGSPLQMTRLTWSHAIGARRYEVWRNNTNSSATATRVAADLTTNFCEDFTVENGSYYYWIKSIGLGGNDTFSEPTTVNLENGPDIASQPSDAQVLKGQAAQFSVTMVGASPFNYQWQLRQSGEDVWNDLADGGQYSGVTTATLTINGVQIATNSEDQFRCIARNETGFATTNAATLIVSSGLSTDFNSDNKPDLVLQNFTTGARSILLTPGTTFVSETNLSPLSNRWSIATTADFNGDGQPDLLLQDSQTGERKVRLMNGTTAENDVALESVPPDWSIAATADFNGDNRVDILWQHTTGLRHVWFMNGTTRIGDVSLGSVPPEWSIAAAADFNGDDKPDIVWQHTSGLRHLWYMNGTAVIGDASLGSVPPEWSIAMAADFNADGHPDILWQNTVTRQCFLWYLNGITQIAYADLGVLYPGWSLAGVPATTPPRAVTHDFNQDGKPDLLLQYPDGMQFVWLMDGTTRTGSLHLGGASAGWTIATTADFNDDGQTDIVLQNLTTGERKVRTTNAWPVEISLETVPPEWSIAAAGDFNGDGKPDLLWQHPTGLRHLWFMNGTTRIGDTSLGSVSPEWSIAAAADFNGDGKPDIVWQHATGLRYVWFMDGAAVIGDASLGSVAPEWSLAMVADFNADGHNDIVWQNTVTGQHYLWFMNGLTPIDYGDLGTMAVAWSIVN